MHLIDTETLGLVDFDGQAPEYAILSHTWGAGEVSYAAFQDEATRSSLQGFRKIELVRAQAVRDKFKYIWIDTCCIDKSSSAELSEAINSMFKWYRDAAVCYVYLEDYTSSEQQSVGPSENVTTRGNTHVGDIIQSHKNNNHEDGNRSDGNDSDMSTSLWRCKWFHRGWTLQELIAPKEIRFFGAGWRWIGDKQGLAWTLSRITGIDINVLVDGPELLSSISIAKRMSWAAGRKTRREEDIAYCLMGLFDVNMPMLYGEGPKAFIRLQEEILKQSEDHSLFCWRASSDVVPFRGIFADSPDEFQNCGQVIPFTDLSAGRTLTTVTNHGIPLTSVVKWLPSNTGATVMVIGLNCRWGDDFESVIALELTSQVTNGDQYLRSSPSQLKTCPSYGTHETVYIAKSVHTTKLAPAPKLHRQYAIYVRDLPKGTNLVRTFSGISFSTKLRVIELEPWMSNHGKTGLDLECQGISEHILLILWASMDPGTRVYTYSFEIFAVANHKVDAKYTGARRPKDQLDERSVLADEGRQLIIATGRAGKVQGFDMFCIGVTVAENQRAPSRRVRSIYSAYK
jgi:hypothetical protein